MRKQKSVTIHDVARLAGVSTSTVSNVLNGRLDQMRSETSERVAQAIAQLGYAPSAAARQLKTGHTPVLGLMVPSVANPFWGALAQNVCDVASLHGYQVLLCNTERDATLEQHYLDVFWSHGAHGVILGSSSVSLDHLRVFAERGMQFISFDRLPAEHESSMHDRFAIDSVSIDNAVGAALAVRHLLDLGHERIGFISGPLRTLSRLARLEGYRTALAEAGITANQNWVWEGRDARGFGDVDGAQLGRNAAHDLLCGLQRPTALIAINDMYALGATAGARDLGLRVPDDLSVIGFDDIVLASITEPPLTTVRQPLRELMHAAVELLVSRLAINRVHTREYVVIAPELVVRESTAPPGATRRGHSTRSNGGTRDHGSGPAGRAANRAEHGNNRGGET